ncbi:hypothetical protein OE88DRAFT_1609343, partial [Heliocybe sulcata]
YDGAADMHLFGRFMEESMAYIRDGNLPRERRWQYVSHYMKGKAFDYYTRSVAPRAPSYGVNEFFTGLFDHCFPINYRQSLRKKLRYFNQGEMSVKEYVYELNDLLNQVGIPDERYRVLTLWEGFSPYIQAKLWEEELNPEQSLWDDIVRRAEIIEIARNAANRVTQPKNKNPKDGRGNGKGGGGGDYRPGPPGGPPGPSNSNSSSSNSQQPKSGAK